MEKRYILLLDSSTTDCSVALGLVEGGKSSIVAQEKESDRMRQSERLAVMASNLLTQLPEGEELSAVCVAEGPGSYTGLRIAAGYAKGLAFARQIPLLAMSTTLLIARSYLATQQPNSDALLLPMIDARRMEVYTALYSSECEPVSEISALVLTDPDVQLALKEQVGSRRLIYFGNGAEKAVELLTTLLPNSRYVPDIHPHAKDMVGDASRLLSTGSCQDVAYWEPFYLKEYEAKKSLNRVLSQAHTN